MKIKLLHLYYDIMNLYGEYGNIRMLEQHLKDQGFDVVVDKKTINEEKKFEEYDFIYIGAGTERNQEVILQDMLQSKDEFQRVIELGKVVLLTGNSYEILGKHINNIPALNIFDFETKHTEYRITGDVICTCKTLKNKVVGFVNNMSSITNNNQPLFEIELGVGENKNSTREGIVYKNLIGTHLIGPILEKNPEIMKFIINKIGTNADDAFEYKEIEYPNEHKGYELVLKELEARKDKK